MQSEDYIERHLISMGGDNQSVITEDDALEAIDIAKREIAWKIHELICEGKDRSFIDKYVTDIVDF